MNRSILAYTSVVMAFISLLFLSEVRRQINGSEQYEHVANFWKDQVGHEQIKRMVLRGQFAEFKQEVAYLLPETKEIEKNQNVQLRGLASVLPVQRADKVYLRESADTLMKTGKALIKKRDFAQGVQLLQRLLDNHPDSLHVIEAHYLIIEAYYQQGNHASVLKWTEKMVEIFPENILTGYALLKAGQVYERDGRFRDAIDVYRTVVSAYSDKGLVVRAQKAVKKLDL